MFYSDKIFFYALCFFLKKNFINLCVIHLHCRRIWHMGFQTALWKEWRYFTRWVDLWLATGICILKCSNLLWRTHRAIRTSSVLMLVTSNSSLLLQAAYNIGGHAITANAIEHALLCFRSPRIGRVRRPAISSRSYSFCLVIDAKLESWD
jgi:hypothetical protein